MHILAGFPHYYEPTIHLRLELVDGTQAISSHWDMLKEGWLIYDYDRWVAHSVRSRLVGHDEVRTVHLSWARKEVEA